MEKERTNISDDDQALVDEKVRELLTLLDEIVTRNVPPKAGAYFYAMAFLSTTSQTAASFLKAAAEIVYDGLEKRELKGAEEKDVAA